MAATPQSTLELSGVIGAVGADPCTVACLTAPPDVVAERVAAREPDAWPGKRALVAHARVLADRIPALAGIDVVINTSGRSAVEVATELHGLLGAAGLSERESSRTYDLTGRSPLYRRGRIA